MINKVDSITKCDYCDPAKNNWQHETWCPLSPESLAKTEALIQKVDTQTIPVVTKIPQEIVDEWQAKSKANFESAINLGADERKDAANKEADANEAEIRLSQTEKGQISEQTQFNWKWKLAIVGGITGIAALLTKLAGCF